MNNVVRIAVVGSSQVGKSAITGWFMFHKFSGHYQKTIEDYYNTKINYKEQLYELDILDTAGAEEFKQIRVASFKSRDAFILVYDITNPKSFENLSLYLTQID